uniref:Uncharacterized protein n=1 Tax=Salmonella typhimurium TaxID=90371 RepID=A0A0G3B4M4_SALTM|nr:hypothetical protein [Salmonella enterica]AKJ19762.1 hypothetical protein [Salmonella enterica subsp. enterica serovar Typhimurium]
MKPMLKSAFFSAVKSLLTNGFRPTFYTVNCGRIGIIAFTDKNGSKQVEQVYSCTSLAVKTIAPRFEKWFAAAVAEFHAAAAETLESGQQVLDKGTVRTVTGFRSAFIRSANGTPRAQARTGVVMLDHRHEVMAGDLVRMADNPSDTVVHNTDQQPDQTIHSNVQNVSVNLATGLAPDPTVSTAT